MEDNRGELVEGERKYGKAVREKGRKKVIQRKSGRGKKRWTAQQGGSLILKR